MNKEYPFLISKPDDEVAAVLERSNVYLSKRAILEGTANLRYLYAVKSHPPIKLEETLDFLSKQYKSKSIKVDISIIKTTPDRLILKQLGLGATSEILLIKRKFTLKDIVIAFEKIYLDSPTEEFTL